MKKVLALVMALIRVLSLVACGGSESNESSKKEETPNEGMVSNSNEIELTLDNYSKYLEVGMGANAEGDSTSNEYYRGYPHIEFAAKVEGISQNFNYNDIKVTGKVKGSYESFSFYGEELKIYASVPFEKEIVVECDINGNGYYSSPDSEQIEMEPNRYIDNEHIEQDFEVTAISGTVTPA